MAAQSFNTLTPTPPGRSNWRWRSRIGTTSWEWTWLAVSSSWRTHRTIHEWRGLKRHKRDMVLLTVHRGLAEHKGKCLAFLDPTVMAEANLAIDDIVEIRSHAGKTALAKVARPFPEDKGKGAIRLDRYLRESIKVSLKDGVRVEKIVAQPARRVCLKPLIAVSLSVRQMENHLQDFFAADSPPVCDGSIIFAALPIDAGGGPFQVVLG